MNAPASGEPIPEVIDVIARSDVPVVILEVPSERIVAASPGAQHLLERTAQPVVGRSLEEFTEDTPSGALQLLAPGRITGYETHRVLRQTGERVRVWVRAIDDVWPVRFVLAVLLGEEPDLRTSIPLQENDELAPVIGSTDARLIIDRISSEARQTLGYRPEDIVGSSLLTLVDTLDVAGVLWALAQSSSSGDGATLQVRIVRADQVRLLCQLVILPLVPPPSCAFALLGDVPPDGLDGGPGVARLLARLGRGIRGASTSQALASSPERSAAGLDRLTSRELDVVSRLLAGDRVPAIAQQLFLSQSTVRNHLSSVFRKLGVGSQQELIALLRRESGIDG
jgi:DNA-binding CsgD family transcriptional regulator